MVYQTVYTIDLLKGRCIPAKNRPSGIIITAISIIIPLVIAITMLGHYLSDKVVISTYQSRIANYDTQMNKLASSVKTQKFSKKQQELLTNSLSEVTSFHSKCIQWSPILMTLVQNIPDSVVLTKLDVEEHSIRKEVPNKDKPGEKIKVRVLIKTLKIYVSGRYGSDCTADVRDFRNRLLGSDILRPQLTDIRVSQQTGRLKGQDVVSYEIDCIFKSIL